MSDPGRKRWTGYGFLLPWLVGMGVFILYPFAGAMYFSLCDYPPLQGPTYIGLGNYSEMMTDPSFHRSMGVTLLYGGIAVPLGVIFALSLALLLNSRIRGQAIYRTIFYLPHLVPTVVVAILWLWIFNPEVGLLRMISQRMMAALDLWAGVFFHLPALKTQTLAPQPAALILLSVPVLIFLAWGPVARRLWASRPGLRTAIRTTAALAAISAGAALLTAAGYRWAPDDMRKLAAPGWLGDGSPFPAGVPWAPSWALWGLILMSLWGVGQMAVIYLAKLQDVPTELYEAAEIDGAGWWQKTRNVTIPMVSPVILFNVVMAIIGTFQIFAQPYIMTQGGPEGKTRFTAMFIYEQAFTYHRLGYASAVAAVLFLLIVVLTLLAFRFGGRHVHYEGR